MTSKENERWLETMNEAFSVALEEGDWELAHNLMAEVHNEGFEPEWKDMVARYNQERA